MVVSLAGCGGTSDAVTDAAATPQKRAELCDTLGKATDMLSLLNFANNADNEGLYADLTEAEEFFGQPSPAEEISTEWADLAEFFHVTSDAFILVDPTDRQQLDMAQRSLKSDAEDFRELLKTAVASGERVSNFSHSMCSLASDLDITDACILLSTTDLMKVFGKQVPLPTSTTDGNGGLSCVWAADPANPDEVEDVSVTIMPLERFERAYVDQREPLDDVAAPSIKNGHVYAGTIGLTDFDERGHSVSFSVGDLAGFVSVNLDKDFTDKDEIWRAKEFARQIIGQR